MAVLGTVLVPASELGARIARVGAVFWAREGNVTYFTHSNNTRFVKVEPVGNDQIRITEQTDCGCRRA